MGHLGSVVSGRTPPGVALFDTTLLIGQLLGTRMMRGIKAVCFVLLACVTALSGAHADYNPLTLIQLLIRADIVASGRIVRLDAASYEFEVARAIRPDTVPRTLTVQRIDRPGTFDLRWGDYAEGQTLVLFAENSDGVGTPLIPLGAAGEGEMPRDEEAVYPIAMAGTAGNRVTAELFGRTVTAYRFGAAEFVAAAEGFYRCFSPRRGAEPPIEIRCDESEIAAYRTQSRLSGHLATIAEKLLEERD
jgi:hypothetical protein